MIPNMVPNSLLFVAYDFVITFLTILLQKWFEHITVHFQFSIGQRYIFLYVKHKGDCVSHFRNMQIRHGTISYTNMFSLYKNLVGRIAWWSTLRLQK